MRTPEQWREHNRASYRRNRARRLASVERWQRCNPEKVSAYKKKYAGSDAGLASARKHSAKFRRENPEKAKAGWQRWYKNNKEVRLSYQRQYRIENRDRINELKRRAALRPTAVSARRKWLQKNRPRLKAIRRARKYGALGCFTETQWQARAVLYGWRCWICHKALNPATICRDHVIPLSRGGTNWPANLRPACRSCNSRKSNKPINLKKDIERAGMACRAANTVAAAKS